MSMSWGNIRNVNFYPASLKLHTCVYNILLFKPTRFTLAYLNAHTHEQTYYYRQNLSAEDKFTGSCISSLSVSGQYFPLNISLNVLKNSSMKRSQDCCGSMQTFKWNTISKAETKKKKEASVTVNKDDVYSFLQRISAHARIQLL